MLPLLLFQLAALFSPSIADLAEMSGFHCMMQHSFKMNRKTHGPPRMTEPPFEFNVEDENGTFIKYYEPGKIYIAKLIGPIHFRGILIQPRLTDQNGFLIGSLKGGQFIEEEIWDHYGIRFQECDTSFHANDSVTHKNDFKKFITKIRWITDRDVGPVQFLMTIAQDNDVYWERWRPRSGFILPESLRNTDIRIVDTIFHNDDDRSNQTLKFVAGNATGNGVRLVDIAGVTNVNGDIAATEDKNPESSNLTIPANVSSVSPSPSPLPSKSEIKLNLDKVPVMVRERLQNRLKLLEQQALSTTKEPSQEENGLVIDPAILPSSEDTLVQVIAEPGPWPHLATSNSTELPVVVFTTPANPILIDRANRRENTFLSFTESESTAGDVDVAVTETPAQLNSTAADPTSPETIAKIEEKILNTDSKVNGLPLTLLNSLPVDVAVSSDAQTEDKNEDSEEKVDFPVSFKSMTLSPKLAKAIGAESKTALIIDPCKDQPCKNGGSCSELEIASKESAEEFGDENYYCTCQEGWTGQNCEDKDFCLNHKCEHGHCRNGANNYTCECTDKFVGKLCNRKCPPDSCENEGKCVEKSNGELGCACIPGTTGARCEIDIDECAARPCKHGASCKNTELNDFECTCTPGWMGKLCDRPCQDVYKSCKTWKRQEQCELMRPHTTFFDVNCAVSCDQCTFLNKTIRTSKPLPPVLIPLAWTLGVWMANVRSVINFPFDFNGTNVQYDEIITFTVSDALMFGTPSINFTSVATNKDDPTDQHVQNGYLTIRPKPDHDQQAALLTTSNHGIIMIEEGRILDKNIVFTPHFQSPHPLTKERMPKEMGRMFSKSGPLLLQSIMKKTASGTIRTVSKYFTRVHEFEYL